MYILLHFLCDYLIILKKTLRAIGKDFSQVLLLETIFAFHDIKIIRHTFVNFGRNSCHNNNISRTFFRKFPYYGISFLEVKRVRIQDKSKACFMRISHYRIPKCSRMFTKIKIINITKEQSNFLQQVIYPFVGNNTLFYINKYIPSAFPS